MDFLNELTHHDVEAILDSHSFESATSGDGGGGGRGGGGALFTDEPLTIDVNAITAVDAEINITDQNVNNNNNNNNNNNPAKTQQVRHRKRSITSIPVGLHNPFAHSPIANSPLANSPLANSPLANSPLANSPQTNSPRGNETFLKLLDKVNSATRFDSPSPFQSDSNAAINSANDASSNANFAIFSSNAESAAFPHTKGKI